MQGAFGIKHGWISAGNLTVLFGDAVDMVFQFGPAGKAVFPCNHQLGVSKPDIGKSRSPDRMICIDKALLRGLVSGTQGAQKILGALSLLFKVQAPVKEDAVWARRFGFVGFRCA